MFEYKKGKAPNKNDPRPPSREASDRFGGLGSCRGGGLAAQHGEGDPTAETIIRNSEVAVVIGAVCLQYNFN